MRRAGASTCPDASKPAFSSASTASRTMQPLLVPLLLVRVQARVREAEAVPHTRAIVITRTSALRGRASSNACCSTDQGIARPSDATTSRSIVSVDGIRWGRCPSEHRSHP